MVILSLTVVPFFTAPGSTPRTSISSGASTRRRGRSRACCSCCRAAVAAASSSRRRRWCCRSILGWNLHAHGAGDRPADGALHDARRRAGGGLDRRQADGRGRRRRAGGGRHADPRAAARRRLSATRCTWPARPAGCRRSTSASILTETYTFWSGLIGGLFLMLSYFGCDQSQVQRYLTAKSVDEARQSLLMSAYVKIPLQALILLTGVLVFALLPVRAAADAVQPDARAERASRHRRGRVSPRSKRDFDASVRRAARRGARRWRGAARGDAAACAIGARPVPSRTRRSMRVRADAVDAGEARHRRRELHRRQLRVSDVHHDAAADRPGRPDDRRDLRGGDVGDRRRAERALDRDGHRLLPAALRAGRERRALPARLAGRDRPAGRCSPAASRCTPRSSGRSSKW